MSKRPRKRYDFSAMKRSPGRRRRGTTPDDALGPLGVVFHQGVTWLLCTRGASPCGRYAQLKLAADCVLGKANYWLSWHLADQRLSAVPDMVRLRRQLPDVHTGVLALLARLDAETIVDGQLRVEGWHTQRERQLVGPVFVPAPPLTFVDVIDIPSIFAEHGTRDCENDVADLVG